MSIVSKLVVVLTAALSVGSVACVIGEARTEVVEYDPHKATQELVCDSDFVKADTSGLTACGGAGGGKGHCYDRTKTTLGADDEFADPKCKDTEVCVPDKILAAAGKKLKTCTFKATGTPAPGACMSVISKQINGNIAALKSDECDDDEGCTPCINPIDKTDTHTCDEQGVHADACTGGALGKQTELCCHGNGLCIDGDAVPGGQQDSLDRQTCKKDNQVCAPAALVDGTPHKCSALGISGVCLDFCFAEMLQGAKAIGRGDCGPTEICLPCLIGKGQGVPGCE
jgi:hypothetical protein